MDTIPGAGGSGTGQGGVFGSARGIAFGKAAAPGWQVFQAADLQVGGRYVDHDGDAAPGWEVSSAGGDVHATLAAELSTLDHGTSTREAARGGGCKT